MTVCGEANAIFKVLGCFLIDLRDVSICFAKTLSDSPGVVIPRDLDELGFSDSRRLSQETSRSFPGDITVIPRVAFSSICAIVRL
jgi:hypothetical protein